MRKNLYLILAFILLLLLALVFFFSNTSGNLGLGSSRFSIEKTENIEQIKITDNQTQSLLTKENDQWKVNQKFLVKQQVIDNFLIALNRIEILYPVSKLERDQVASILKKEGILVEIENGNIRKTRYYVSNPAMSNDKTYMMMTRSDEPYVVKIPGFKGHIAQLFVAQENFWRDRVVFNYMPQQINTVTVEYSTHPEKSFSIKNFNDGSFALLNGENNPQSDFNIEKTVRYLTYFQHINFEDVITDLSNLKADSVMKSAPYVQITIEDTQGLKNEIKIYQKPSEGKKDAFGEQTKYDLDRAYAMLNNNHELLLIQYYIFDPLLKEFDYFR